MKLLFLDFLIFLAIFMISVTLIEYSGDDWMLDGAGDIAGVMIIYFYARLISVIDHE